MILTIILYFHILEVISLDEIMKLRKKAVIDKFDLFVLDDDYRVLKSVENEPVLFFVL